MVTTWTHTCCALLYSYIFKGVMFPFRPESGLIYWVYKVQLIPTDFNWFQPPVQQSDLKKKLTKNQVEYNSNLPLLQLFNYRKLVAFYAVNSLRCQLPLVTMCLRRPSTFRCTWHYFGLPSWEASQTQRGVKSWKWLGMPGNGESFLRAAGHRSSAGANHQAGVPSVARTFGVYFSPACMPTVTFLSDRCSPWPSAKNAGSYCAYFISHLPK